MDWRTVVLSSPQKNSQSMDIMHAKWGHNFWIIGSQIGSEN